MFANIFLNTANTVKRIKLNTCILSLLQKGTIMAWVLVIRAKQFETDSVTFRTYPTSKTNHKKNLKFRRKIYIKISHLCVILLLNHTVGEQQTCYLLKTQVYHRKITS